MFLFERKMLNNNVVILCFSLGFGGCFALDRAGLGGGLPFSYNSDIDISLLIFSIIHINVHIRGLRSTKEWSFTGFYGNPRVGRRSDSLRLLERIGNRRVGPLLCRGDSIRC